MRAAVIAVALCFASVSRPAVAQPAGSVNGKYSGLVASFRCDQDRAKYGAFQEAGYFEALRWCGRDVGSGYWVWVAPHWYVWSHKARSTPARQLTPRQRASAGGKYRDLIMTLHVPKDEATYGKFHDHSYYAATTYAGRSVPAGHWVYVAPTWYVWRTKDLTAAGLTTMERRVRLQARTVTFRFEFKPAHRRWATAQLDALIRGVRAVEQWSGVPFPGADPYRIYEGTSGNLLGFASARSMYLASPPRSKTWTLMHEMLHIWNAGARPKWVTEGQANFVSFWLMRRLKMPFEPGNTLDSWIAAWKRDQNTARDLPLHDGRDNYAKLKQGKAMELWSILYQRYGPSFLRWAFIQTTRSKQLSLRDLQARLRQHHSEANPARVLSGWVTRGPYSIKSHKLYRPKFPLP